MYPTTPELSGSNYQDLRKEAQALFEGIPDFQSNASNLSALIYHRLPDINWSGFYWWKGGELWLGPFQGKPACVRIRPDQGVCGAAARTRQIQRVADVHEFPGHIACDPASQSELVIPVLWEESFLGVLDVDSPVRERFSPEDATGLASLVDILLKATIAAGGTARLS